MDAHPVLAAASLYLACGLSILPVRPHDKAPLQLWARYQTERATEADVAEWVAQSPQVGLGIVGGPVSGNLAILDVDDVDFAEWLLTTGEQFLRTSWTVRTGSGKLHFYLRGEVETKTTTIKIPRKLADVRGTGAYAVAPPSIHPSGGVYETLYGSPTAIAVVRDPLFLFNEAARAFSGNTAISTNGHAHVDDDTPLMRVRPPDDPIFTAEYQVRLKGMDLPPKIRKTIFEGATPGEGLWLSVLNYSDMDFAVVCELIHAGMTDEDIEIVYANFPIGSACYQNVGRAGSYGWPYLAVTLKNAHKKQIETAEAERDASGENFKVVRVVRVEYEDPVYELEVENDIGEMRSCLFSNDQIWSERMFCRRLSTVMRSTPKLRPAHKGSSNFPGFVDILIRMAEIEAVPSNATAAGNLRGFIVDLLNQEGRLIDGVPEDRYSITLGWRDGTQIYVRGSVIIRHTSSMRPPPGPEKVWAVLRNLGGDELDITYGSAADPVRERLWQLPQRSLHE